MEWCDLPQVVLSRICSFLQDKERSDMSQVCKSWLRAYHDPYLWQRRKWSLSGYGVTAVGRKACGFAKQHGQHLRYLTITCDHCSFNLYQNYHEAIQSILHELHRKAKLKEFHLIGLRIERYCYTYKEHLDTFVGGIVRFLRSQKTLLVVDMSHSQFFNSEGCKMLESIGHACGRGLRRLHIEGLFHHSDANIVSHRRYQKAISSFRNLRSLSLNYSGLCDRLMETLVTNLAGKLKCLKMNVIKNPSATASTISPSCWTALRRACPQIHVKLFLLGIGHASDVVPVLSPQIPLQELCIFTGLRNQAEWKLRLTLQHISQYFPSSLEICTLKFDNNQEIVDEELVEMLKQCSGLKEVTYNAVFDIPTIDTVCSMRERNEIALRKFHVTNRHLNAENKPLLDDVFRTKYQSTISSQNLDFRVDPDLTLWETRTILIPLQPVQIGNHVLLGPNGWINGNGGRVRAQNGHGLD